MRLRCTGHWPGGAGITLQGLTMRFHNYAGANLNRGVDLTAASFATVAVSAQQRPLILPFACTFLCRLRVSFTFRSLTKRVAVAGGASHWLSYRCLLVTGRGCVSFPSVSSVCTRAVLLPVVVYDVVQNGVGTCSARFCD